MVSQGPQANPNNPSGADNNPGYETDQSLAAQKRAAVAESSGSDHGRPDEDASESAEGSTAPQGKSKPKKKKQRQF
ncbi:hypothetical protein PtA15_1A537 [Puccinia triticina]|uniref:Uncharacterized protein n=1 Tax=Puccinia triticina TaxID=208348 RepID=A0ABY7C8H7_9BASI|nr:uncharacterized protein PtA15_1A537 [Puccinia triticina]WAQ81198.1 hypothetical protein PtA15_1A537 [Puccinia triticina]